MTVLGTKYHRRDAHERITGAIKYTEDFFLPDMAYAALVRSPVAAGSIRRIDLGAAKAVEGVVSILTAADVPARRYGNIHKDQPILAGASVCYVGEPIAIVTAATLAAARHAASLVKVDIEPAPFVTDPSVALDGAAPAVHDGIGNVLDTAIIRRGDVAGEFARAHKIVRTRIETHRAYQGYLEPRGVIAAPTAHGLSLIMSTQQPFGVRSALADLFDIPMSRIEIMVPAVGGGFGGKLHLGFAPHAMAAAIATQRPVQLICERGEDMRTANPRENSVVELVSAVDREGRLLARKSEVIMDSGAYALDIQFLNSMAAFYSTGPYYIENLELTSRAVYTNTPPTGSFRGPTGPQCVYAVEKHMDDIAEALGLDRFEVRRRNFISKGQRGPAGELMTSNVTIGECMDKVRAKLDEFRSNPVPGTEHRTRGYGLACAWWNTLGTPSSATVEVHEDGSATISSGGTEIGTSVISTTLPMLVSEMLGIAPEKVVLNNGSTRDAPFDSGSRGSRTLYSNGNATISALRQVSRQIKEEAAEILGVPAERLVLREGRVESIDNPNAFLSLAQVASSAKLRSGPVVASARYKEQYADVEGSELENVRFVRLGDPSFSCHGVEIALDEDTGRIEVLRYVAVQDIGRVLNPVAAVGQVEGGVVQGIGYSITENLELDAGGRVRNDNFHDYRIPTIADAPHAIETIFIEDNPATKGPFGAKGLGEPPTILPAAAIGSALRDLVGAQPSRLPFDAHSIAAFLKDRKHASEMK